MTKEEYVTRPDDIDLGKWWNEMRRRQRDASWGRYQQMCGMAQSNMQDNQLGRGGSGFLNSLFGEGFSEPSLY